MKCECEGGIPKSARLSEAFLIDIGRNRSLWHCMECWHVWVVVE